MTITAYSLQEFLSIIAGLVREGLTFESSAEGGSTYTIRLTGGY